MFIDSFGCVCLAGVERRVDVGCGNRKTTTLRVSPTSMKKIHLAVRSAARDHVQSILREALDNDFQALASGLFRTEIEGMLDRALQAELATFLGRSTYERNGKGPWRNGSKTVADRKSV